MRRGLLSYALILTLVISGFAAAVFALNNDLYSAAGFVRSYLSALERHDARAALAFDGVVVPASASPKLMTDAALGDLAGFRLISDLPARDDARGDVAPGDQRVVRFATVIAGEEHTTEFHVERSGTRFGLFAIWRFTVSPVATLEISADHDDRATANGVELTVGTYPVLVPTLIAVDHDSKYLEADAVTVAVVEVGGRERGAIGVVAKPELDKAAHIAVNAYLDDCVTQHVLKPTGCPMSETILNRVNDTPEWSLETYPEVALEPGTTPGEWRSANATGLATVTVEVKSILDGTLSRIDESVYFSAVYVVAIGQDDSLSVTVDFATLGGFTG